MQRNAALPFGFPQLRADLVCDVAIIGGGVTGALLADRLSREGVDVVLLDKRPMATGSTAASTALLMYDLDVTLLELAERYGMEFATRCYQASLAALEHLTSVAEGLAEGCDFSRRRSLYFARRKEDSKDFQEECAARRKAGIEVELLSSRDIAALFPFQAEAGLVSTQAAQCDPVKLTHALLGQATAGGARVFSETEVVAAHMSEAGGTVITKEGPTVKCSHAVFATGYESGRFLKRKVGSLHSTYAICSTPHPHGDHWWHEDWLLWDTDNPYLYLRTTPDGRAIIGGGDVPFADPDSRDALLRRKTDWLVRRFEYLFPGQPFKVENAWTGTFGESDDGLPMIGGVPEQPRCLFALGYGGNGITFGMLAAEIISDAVLGRRNPDAELFSFDRA